MSCYGCACDHCLYNAELEAWYMTPGEVQNAEDICFCCDECKHYDGDFSKRSQWRPDCPRHKFPEKYLMGGDKINGQITGEHQGHHHAGR